MKQNMHKEENKKDRLNTRGIIILRAEEITATRK